MFPSFGIPLLMKSSQSSPLLVDLISYYRLNGNELDSHGTNNGSPTAITYGTGKIGQAANGNGSTSQINLGTANLNLTGDVSISAWVKLSNNSSYWFIASRLVGSGGASNVYEFRVEPGGALSFGNSNGRAAGGSMSAGAWHHVVGTRGSGLNKVYIDGVLVASSYIAGPASLPSQPTLLGTRDDGYTHMGFELDEVGFWERELLDTEVTQLYNSGIGLTYPFSALSSVLLGGLVDFWQLNGNSNGVNGNNGTDTSITYSTGNGKITQGAGFNGSTSKIVLSSANPTTITVAAWVKLAATGTSGRVISSGHENYPTSMSGFVFNLASDKIKLTVAKNTGYTDTVDLNSAVSTTTLTTGVWYHVVGTYDGSNIKIYVNGALESTTAWASGLAYSSTVRTRIGSQLVTIFAGETDNHLPWNGALDEVGLWNRALSATEITQLYNSGTGLAYPF